MANWIRDARKQAKLTQVQLCERYKIPRSTLQEWESHKYEPPVYVKELLLRCIEADFNIKLEKPKNDSRDFTLTYTDGTPLCVSDYIYVAGEMTAKKVEAVSAEHKGVQSYRCIRNGFVFNTVR